jgi:deazaflavin-dependent oxidoreductase (nitroreductase family)
VSSQPAEEVFDSPAGWVARHIGDYVRTDGKKGHRWHGVDTLLLTTRGRRSGKLRRTALIYGRDGDRYIVVASRGGDEHHPSWYLNLVEHPEVTIQVGPQTFSARARTADAKEKPRLWRLMSSIWPDYDRYQARTSREIPVVIIEGS